MLVVAASEHLGGQMPSLNSSKLTDEVVSRYKDCPDLRLKQIMESLVRHLHSFARDVNLTEAEWLKGIDFVTKVGQFSNEMRQEFILLSDVLIDVWQAGEDGLYSSQDPNKSKYELRGKFRSDRDGNYHFRSVLPKGYQIPTDGPVGVLMRATHRPPWRPAHLHFMISAEGYKSLITHLFVKGAPHIDEDAVFGVKPSLIQEFKRKPSGKGYTLDYDFGLSPTA